MSDFTCYLSRQAFFENKHEGVRQRLWAGSSLLKKPSNSYELFLPSLRHASPNRLLASPSSAGLGDTIKPPRHDIARRVVRGVQRTHNRENVGSAAWRESAAFVM
jgi:hypothetical protein